jgi:hypothetical protein
MLTKSITIFAVAILLTVLMSGAIQVEAGQAARQAAGCATYLTNLTVDYVNSVPHSVNVGDTIVTTFHVVYPDGTPASLSPETASFSWTGPSGQKVYPNVQVVPNGTAGFYNYTQSFTQDLVQATGAGSIKIAVTFCSCQDALGNRGPTGDISSVETLIPTDNSVVGPKPQTISQVATNYAVPAIIIILLILALLMFLLRRRRRK